jgi:putative lipoprotein
MRSTRITALGIVIFLFLQAALFSCLRIGGKPKYDIDEDSLFFSRMPPRTETGANIVAFELDGKPYVFPKEGMRDYPVFFSPGNWGCLLAKKKSDQIIEYIFTWTAIRNGKKYNQSVAFLQATIPECLFHQKSFSIRGNLRLGGWFSGKDSLSLIVTRFVPEENLICGEFSGELKFADGHISKRGKITNGFFDLRYKNSVIY